jgi:hypothetical protein
MRRTVIAFLVTMALTWAREKPSPVPDYSAAHSALIALGMPAVSPAAKWVSIPQNRGYNNSKLEINTKGTHWLITVDEKNQLLALGAVSTTPLPSSRDPKKQEPKEADLKADVEAVHKALKKFKSLPSDEFTFAFDYYGGTESLASVVVFAAQLRQAGHPDLANSLTHATLIINPAKQEAIIDAAISQIADSFYKDYTDQFANDHNWSTYHQNLLSLLKRFPRGWNNRDAVALCIEPTARRAKDQLPALPALDDMKLAALAAALIEPILVVKKADDENTFHGVDLSQYPAQHRAEIRQQILSMTQQGIPLPQSDDRETIPTQWLLEPVQATEESPPVNRILAKGIHAIPLLAAIAEDNTLTHIISNSSSYSAHYRYSGSSTPSALQLHQSLRRPITRGELATRLLQSALPDPSSHLRSLSAADIAQTALDFWKLHKDKKDWQIVIPFLDGDRNQRLQALKTLSEAKSTEALALFKKTILTSPNQSDFDLVLEFIRHNADQETQFIEDYKNALRKMAASPPSRNEYTGENHAQYINATIKKIEAISKKRKPEDLIREILADKPDDADDAVETLLELLSEKPSNETILLLLNTALKATDPTISRAFLTGSYQLEFDSESPAREIPPVEMELWKKLLNDKRALPKGSGNRDNKTYTIDEVAAAALYFSYSQQDYYEARRWAPVLKKDFKDLVRERGIAIAEGRTLDPWPDANKVTPERLAEIVKSIDQQAPLEILAIIAKLTPDESAAWSQWLAMPGDLPHPDSIKQLKFLVNERNKEFDEQIADDPKIDQLALPFHITADSLIKWLDHLLADMKKNSCSAIVIAPNRSTRMELQVFAAKLTLPSSQKDDSSEKDVDEDGYSFENLYHHFLGAASGTLDEDEDHEAVAIVTFGQRGRSTDSLTLTATLKGGKITKNDDYTNEKITEFLASSAEAGFSQPFYLQVQILSREDHVKFQKHFEELEDLENEEE